MRRGAWKHHGQQKIDSDRAREIQAALIREKYLDGEPSGIWDQRTKDAMSRYQEDHGWQSKSLPDSRALIQLGLGPKHENLINPGSIAPSTEATPSAAFSGRPLN
ncbi:MAG TPA: peptidoglycan-binding domain-containing protein [Terriglobales bacterium]|nr:peptidoglycan-binding domain-containing protein [Terriglobales bacterium]